jgi:hypothetical protein
MLKDAAGKVKAYLETLLSSITRLEEILNKDSQLPEMKTRRNGEEYHGNFEQ